jgi:hypothetical protein
METINSAVIIYIFSKNSTDLKQIAKSKTANASKRIVINIKVIFGLKN